MNWRLITWSGVGLVALGAAGGGAWILSLPAAPTVMDAPPIAKEETDAILTALKPPKRHRPLIAIIGINDATETTDYLMPFGVLRRSDVADVVLLATEPGPVKLYPALEVEPHATIAIFDAQHPEGADYVIVPAMSRDDDATVLDWLRSQAAKARRSSACAPEPRSLARPACWTASRRRPTGISSRSFARSVPRSAMSQTGGW